MALSSHLMEANFSVAFTFGTPAQSRDTTTLPTTQAAALFGHARSRITKVRISEVQLELSLL